jgi:DNA-binding NarL/FixJ family response regulator
MKDENEHYKNIYSILTRREIEVTKLIVAGNTDKEITTKLGISFHTVRTHHKNILHKTGQKNISMLIIFALKSGLVP